MVQEKKSTWKVLDNTRVLVTLLIIKLWNSFEESLALYMIYLNSYNYSLSNMFYTKGEHHSYAHISSLIDLNEVVYLYYQIN